MYIFMAIWENQDRCAARKECAKRMRSAIRRESGIQRLRALLALVAATLVLASPVLALPGLEQACNDLVDNDTDGLVDLADPDCGFEYLCQDGLDNDLDSLIDGADPDCTCLDDITGFAGSGCSANDLDVVLIGLGVQSDGCVSPTDQMVVQLGAQLEGRGGNTRYDVDLWIPLDGGDARTGTCLRQTLTPGISPTGTTPSSTDLTNGCGPYRNDDGDACNEINGAEDPCQTAPTPARCPSASSTIDAIYDFPLFITLPCQPTSGGFLQLATCVSWDQNAATTCNDPSQALPGTNSKCQCVPATPTDLPVADLGLSCSCTPSTIDAGDTASCTVSYTNNLPGVAGDPCLSDPSVAERFRCGTSSFLRYKIAFDDANGSVSNISSSRGAQTLVDTDAMNGDDQIVWTPASLLGSAAIIAANETDTLTFDYTIDPGAPPNTVLMIDTTSWWNNDLTFSNEVQQAALGCNLDVTTTPVTLASVRARPAQGAAKLTWSTATETGNIGFHVYIETAKGWERLTYDPIPSKAVDSSHPLQYSVDLPTSVSRYAIEDISVDGSTRYHGPFELDTERGNTPQPKAIEWSTIGQERLARAALPSVKGNPIRVDTVELLVEEDGIYRLHFEDLLAAGIDIGAWPIGHLAVLEGGEPVPLRVVGKGTFGPSDFIEIIGQAADSLYTRTNVYSLIHDRQMALRVATESASPTGHPAASYRATHEVARDREYSIGSPTADPWYDTRLLAFSNPRQWSFPLNVEGLLSDDEPPAVAVDVWGSTVWPADPDHHLRLYINETLLVDEVFDGRVARSLRAALPLGLLSEGTNTLQLELPADLGLSFDLVNLDGYRVTYPRHFVANDDVLRFVAAGEMFEIEGFSSSEVVAYRLEADGPRFLENIEVVTAGDGVVARLPGTVSVEEHMVATVGAIRTPGLRVPPPASDLASGPAAYLIIAHSDFLAALEPLVSLREASGLTVKTVDVEAIYRQRGTGIVDPRAIRDYIAFAAEQLGTRYVLLVGGDTYDYRNDLGLDSISFIPTLYADTGFLITYSPADPLYTDFDGDNVPDLPIGRLPVRTVEELELVVEKIQRYEAKDYRQSAVFGADRFDPVVGFGFSQHSDEVIAGLPLGWQVERSYIDSLGVEEARRQLIEAIDGGVALTSFIGHSGPNVWSFERLLNSLDVRGLTNQGRPTVVMQWGCWNTYHVEPQFDTLGHAFLVSGDQGAAAVLGSSTLLETTSARALSDILAPLLTVPGVTLGDAITEAKKALALTHPNLLDVQLGWTLLGDPAMKID